MLENIATTNLLPLKCKRDSVNTFDLHPPTQDRLTSQDERRSYLIIEFSRPVNRTE